MPSTLYAQSSPELRLEKSGEVDQVRHNHVDKINFASWDSSSADRTDLRQTIGQQEVKLAGCMTFFHSLANDTSLNAIARAEANAALAEDKARLKEFRSHKPCCLLL